MDVVQLDQREREELDQRERNGPTWDSYDYDARAKRGNRSQCPLPLGRFLYLVKFTSQERRKQLSLPQQKEGKKPYPPVSHLSSVVKERQRKSLKER